MQNDLTISPEALKERAATIRSKVQNIDDTLKQVTSEFGKVSDSYAGKASNALMEKYEALAPKYNEFLSSMSSYADFLDKTAEKYAATEAQLESAANKLAD